MWCTTDLIVCGSFKELQGNHKWYELFNPVETKPTEYVPVEISVLSKKQTKSKLSIDYGIPAMSTGTCDIV